MRFESVDPYINSWVSKTDMYLFTKDRDSEVRSFQWVGESAKAEISVEIKAASGGQDHGVCVCVFDYADRLKKTTCREADVGAALDEALKLAKEWCA